MTGNLYELRGRTEGAVADVRPASALDLAGVAIIDNFLRALTADDNDHNRVAGPDGHAAVWAGR